MLNELLSRLHEEEKLGYVNKESLLQIAEYLVSRSLREINQDPNSRQAYEVLIKYRTYKLIATNKHVAQFNLDKERLKHYKTRCSRCGLAITNMTLSNHVC